MAEEHIALVTGGGSGIGAAVCRELARSGAFVLVAGRKQVACTHVAEAIRSEGGEAAVLSLDVTDKVSIDAAARDATRLAGPVDWLVSSAGIAISAPLLARESDSARDLYAAHMDVNFHGARRVFEAVLPSMLEKGYGRVVQVVSSAGLRGYPYVAAYTASKHALLGYTRAAALELSPKGVAVSAVCPHYVDSPMTADSVARMVEKTNMSAKEARAFLAAQNPSGELVSTEEVAHTVHELLASDLTGAVVELVGNGESREVDRGHPIQ